MSEALPAGPVFISYTSDDAASARRLCEALRAGGVEVWFDQNELAGGELWDAKIRERIQSCALFVALVSAATEARAEGYFRREWKLAADRTHDMADGVPFLLPVVIDETPPYAARVPARFRDVHWMRLPPNGDAEPVVRRVQQMLVRDPGLPPPSVASRGRFTSPPFAEPPARRRWPRAWMMGLAVSALMLGGGAVFFWRTGPLAPPPAPAKVALDPHAIAVLPFTNFDEAGRDYFSDGLAEEILNALAQNRGLRVAARTSSFAYRDRHFTAQQIGEQLHVGNLIEGTVRRVVDKLRITVQLVSTADGLLLWSAPFDSDAKDVFAAQEQIARAIAAKLEPSGTAPLRVKRATANPEAYDAYLRGRSFQVKPPAADTLNQAIFFYGQATELDPNYAMAWARHGQVLTRQYNAGNNDAESGLERARRSIATALRLDPELPEAHLALATALMADWTHLAEAEQQFQLAEAALPGDPDVLAAHAMLKLNLGQRTQALPLIEQAITVDPQNADIANYAGTLYDAASLYPDALAEFERAYRISGWTNAFINRAWVLRNQTGDLDLVLRTLDLMPDAARDDYYWRTRSNFLRAKGETAAALAALDHMKGTVLVTQFAFDTVSYLRARALEVAGREGDARPLYEDALRQAEAYRAAHPHALRIHAALANIYASLGREKEALAAANRCVEIVPPSENRYLAARLGLRMLAHVQARFGRSDEALALVREQVAAGFWKRQDLLHDVDWWLLRRDPRFLALAQQAPP